MKAEIISYIAKKHNSYNSIAVENEIDKMISTEGLDGKPLINKFYYIWKNTLDSNNNSIKIGKHNKINSWTAYYLGITTEIPNGEFLEKRRAFARKGFPDIDSDFDYDHQHEMYQYVIDKYGRDYVGNIGTHGALKLKSYIKRAVKAIDPQKFFADTKEGKERWQKETRILGDEIVESLPKQFGAKLTVKSEDGKEHEINNVKDATEYIPNFRSYIKKYPDILEHSENLLGLVSQFGVHAAGIVISSVPLCDIAPLRTSKIKDSVNADGEIKYALATQFSNDDLEFMGLIKFDLLALSTLSVIARTIKLVKQNYDIDIDIENIPLNDAKTFKLYQTGKLMGVFQCESRGMQKTMMEMQADSYNDIMAGIALYRPGPMDSIAKYCARKRGEEKVEYFHSSIEPFVKPYLKKTYGIAVYQESIMQICNSLAGFSITDGYAMIKAVGKKIKSLLDKYRDQFVSGCQTNEVPKEIAEQYWDKFITPFASYGFNLAHSACYGFLSYQTAYLKAHFPEEFMISHMNVILSSNKQDKYQKIAQFEKECQNMGMEFLPKSINKCGWDYSIVSHKDKSRGILKSQIRYPLRCKGISDKAVHDIIANQPYEGFRDFAFKTTGNKVDIKAIECLAESGFFKDSKGKKIKKEDVIKDFSVLRNDMKKNARKGYQSGDLFE